MVKNPLANAGDTRDAGLIPGSGRSPGVGNGNLLQYFCLENSMDRRLPGCLWGCRESYTTEQLSTRSLDARIFIVGTGLSYPVISQCYF